MSFSDGPLPDCSAGYEHPLATRYASAEMVAIWSAPHRYRLWRQIWLALAESEHELGLRITTEQLAALRSAVDMPIDFEAVARHEQRTRHDVMAHIHALEDAAPAARGVIHVGATSMDVVDNADLLLMKAALQLLAGRLAAVVRNLADFSQRYADLPTLGFTHLQPAQLTTVGKRAALWLADFVVDLERIHELGRTLRCRGLRGATGTQASFLRLLGNPESVAALESAFARKLGFEACYPVVGQTYSRKVDLDIAAALASFAASAHKCCNDIRLLAMLKEIEEPFEQAQVGSSAMPYKRNPALCERITGIARYLVTASASPAMTLSAQMLERTLDDSSNKRIVMPELFMAADAISSLLAHVFGGLVVYPQTIAARIQSELPFIATEDLLMEAVARGSDRQALHERIRQHAQQAGLRVKQEGAANDLLDRLAADPAFAGIDLKAALAPERYVGLAPQQTRAFLKEVVEPLLARLALNMAQPPPPRV